MHTYPISLGNRSELNSRLEKIRARGAKKGLEGTFSWSFSKPYMCTEGLGPVCEVTIIGETPRCNDWEIVCVLDHTPTGNIVHTFGDESGVVWAQQGACCDHCKTQRRRSRTFIARNTAGEVRQIGSTCMVDYFGDAVLDAVSQAIAIVDAESACADDLMRMATLEPSHFLLTEFMGRVADEIENRGWHSRSTSERGNATVDRVLASYHTVRISAFAPSAAQSELVAAAIEWAKGIAPTSNYESNLKAIADAGSVDRKNAGIAASLITAYQRAMQRAAEEAAKSAADSEIPPSTFVGVVGQKVVFGAPVAVGKRGQPLKNAPVSLSSDPVTLTDLFHFDTMYGMSSCLKFRTAEGAILTWMSASAPCCRDDVGKRFVLRGTVKRHENYQNRRSGNIELQTVLSRCSVTEAV